MNLRPWKTIKLLKEIDAARLKAISQLYEMIASLQNINGSLQRVNELRDAEIERLKHQSQIETVAPLPLPTLEAVEGLCNAFFAQAPVSLVQQAIEGCQITKLEPSEVIAAQRCIKKLWYHAAMRRLERVTP